MSQVPEHSREDTFFDIIREKLCVGATKEYDVVTQYLKLTMSHGTTNTGIDNQKLYDTYNMPLGTLQTEKLGGHPAFHGLIQAQSPEAVALMSQINDRLTPLTHRMSDIHRNLGSRAREFYGQVNSAENQHDEERVKEDLLKMYQFFGPHVLEAIHAYEEGARETRNALETSEEDLKKWLGIFKDSKGFKKLETREKFYVRSYVERKDKEALQEQRAAEAQRRAIVAAEAEQRRLAAVQKKEEKEARKKERDDALATTQVKHAATPIPLEAATNDFSAMLFSGPDTNTSASASGIIAENLKASPLPTISAPTRQPDVSPTITENCVALATPSPTFSVPTGQPEATLSGFVVPKTKVKTRGSVVGETTEKEEAATSTQSDEKESVILPDYFHDVIFQSLIKNLLSERNERKLKSEFARLKKDYDIISENQERKNKGYFMVVSPITQKRTVKTYHTLHDPENPFASLFMAMRDVLNGSQLSIILSGS